jgi:hypothetical protein
MTNDIFYEGRLLLPNSLFSRIAPVTGYLWIGKELIFTGGLFISLEHY